MAKKAITQATYAVDNIQSLPIQVQGQASTVQLAFDQSNIDQRSYNNNVLITELQSEVANSAGANTIGTEGTFGTDNVADEIKAIKVVTDSTGGDFTALESRVTVNEGDILDLQTNKADITYVNTQDDALSVRIDGNDTDITNLQNSKANDNEVVHNTGNETVAGEKNFTTSPLVPTPTTDLQAANRAFVLSQAPLNIPDNSLTEDKMAADMKKQSGGVYPYDLGVIPKQLGGGALINGNFDISQRGTSFTGTNQYTLDRWYAGLFLTNVNQSLDVPIGIGASKSLQLIGNGGGSTSLYQRIENPNNVLYNKKSTLSFWVKGDSAFNATARIVNRTTPLAIQSKTYSITTAWTKITLTFDESTDWNSDDIIELLPMVSTTIPNAESVRFSQIKFELGEVANDFIPKTYAEELRESRRYANIMEQSMRTRAYEITANTIRFSLPLTSKLRINPTLIGTQNTNILVVNLSGTSQSGFSFTVDAADNVVRVTATKTSHGLTDAYLFMAVGTGFDSEI